ncbi:MAG: 6,7-dimethyl-8-ribityllumazine synthase [Arsenophonus endosymbiont of Ceratovacuna japonica]
MKVIKSMVVSSKSHIAIVVARFNHFINNHLLEGSIDTLERIGQVLTENITIVWVPGAYELPLIIKILVETKKYNAVIALASIIRGETPHFEYIANECSTGLSNISITNYIPITFGVLITDNIKQAIERAGTKVGNKGSDAALAALEMINIIQTIKD